MRDFLEQERVLCNMIWFIHTTYDYTSFRVLKEEFDTGMDAPRDKIDPTISPPSYILLRDEERLWKCRISFSIS
ncbi:hypothetical protein C0J52_25984 [Blattella germanica]|nr:hypothetical protein C0J52_25984 [Blattella germanica]